MPTIARLVVEMLGDAAPLRRTFQQVSRDASAFGRDMRRQINTEPLISSAKASREGVAAGNALVRSLTQQYNRDMASTREQRARGIISDADMRIAGERAAVQFNRTILQGINALRNNRMLSPGTHNKLVAELKDAGFEAGKAAREELQRQLDQLKTNLQSVGAGLSRAGRVATTAVTLPVVAAGAFGVKEAADAAEAYNKFLVIFGRTAETVDTGLARMHAAIPATTADLREQASQFGGLFQSMGIARDEAVRMSLRLVELGGDLTSLHNIPVQETMQRLFSGLVGETEAVRRFGVDISEARLKVLAHNAGLGDNVQALDRAQRTQLIFNEILRATANAHGDAAATATSAANSFRFLQRDATEAAIAFGQRMLPTIVPIVQGLTRVLVTISQLSPRTLDLIIKVGLFAAAVGPVLIVLGALVSSIGTLIGALGALAPALVGAAALLAGPAGWIVLLGAATAALFGFIAASNAAKPNVDALAESFRGLTTAQMTQQLAEGSAEMLKLRQEAERLRAVVRPVMQGQARITGGGVERLDPNQRRLAELTSENGLIAQQQARLDALGVAINRNSADAARSAGEMEALMRRSEAAAAAMLAGMGQNTAAQAAAAKAAAREARAFLQVLSGEVSSLNDLREQGTAFGQNLAAVNIQALSAYGTVQRMLDAHGGVFDATTARLLNMKAELLKFGEVARAEALRTLDLQKLIAATPTVEQARINRQLQQGGANNVVVQPIVQPVTVIPVVAGRTITTPSGDRGPAVGPATVDPSVLRFRLAVDNMLGALGTSREQLVAFRRAVAEAARGVVDGVRPLFAIGRALINVLPTQFRNAANAIIDQLSDAADAIRDTVRTVVTSIGDRLDEAANGILRRFRPAVDVAASALNVLATTASVVRQVYQPVLSALGDIINPLNFFGSVMQEIAGALRPIFAPQQITRRQGESDEDFSAREQENQSRGINALLTSISRLAATIARALQPVFEALAPVVEALIPVVRAVMEVLGPILAALAPLFRAFVPILEALFPIFKLVAIAATYVAQAFGIVASVVLRAVGNIIIGLGKIVEAFARAVDALPFVSAKGAIATAQGIQTFGRALLHSADEMNNMANAMAHAREEIGNVQLTHASEDAADGVGELGDAARQATESLLYVPQVFRYRARLVETWEPRELSSGVPTMAGPNDTRPSIPGGGDTFIVQQLNINEATEGEATLDRLRRQARRESMATYGTTERAGDMLR